MARRAFFPRDNDIDLSDSHMETIRIDIRPAEKRAYIVAQFWQSEQAKKDGFMPLHEMRQWWSLDQLVQLHQLMKANTKKGLLAFIADVESVICTIDTDEKGDFNPAYGSIPAEDTDPLA